MNQEKDEAIFLVNEPLSGDVVSISVKEQFADMPSPTELQKLLQQKCESMNCGEFAKHMHDNEWIYNPIETPAEDEAISKIVNRLRIVQTSSVRSPNKLLLAEDPRLVAQMNHMLDHATDLPFFCTCSSTSLYFEADAKKLSGGSTGLKNLVFGSVRKSKPLHNFLVNVVCNLNVILTSYNSGIKITMSWRELLAHLTEYRNPFVTAELKPKFLEPHQYVYVPHEEHIAYVVVSCVTFLSLISLSRTTTNPTHHYTRPHLYSQVRRRRRRGSLGRAKVKGRNRRRVPPLFRRRLCD